MAASRVEPLQDQRLWINGAAWRGASRAGAFFLSGPHLYEVGDRRGGFPPTGWHLPGEMGGVWVHPFKALEGVRWTIETEAGPWALEAAERFEYRFFEARFRFQRGPWQVVRRDVVSPHEPLLCWRLWVRNRDARPHRLVLRTVARASLRPAWPGAASPQPARWQGHAAGTVAAERGSWGVALRSGPAPTHLEAEGPEATFTHALRLEAGQTATFTFHLAASQRGGVPEATRRVEAGPPFARARAQGARRYRILWRGGLQFDCGDPHLNAAFDCAKANLELLRVRGPRLGRYCLAGVPEYVQLFGVDTAYAVPGLMVGGLEAEARAALETLARYAARQGGRVPHEIATDGTVVHPGLANETPQFVTACWHYVRWRGDAVFLRWVYPLCRRGLGRLLGALNGPGDLFPAGEGVVERPGPGVRHADVTAALYQALGALSAMAAALERPPEEIVRYRRLAACLKRAFNRRWWLPARELFADTLARGGAPLLLGHWTVVLPLAVGLAEEDKGRRALSAIARGGWLNRWGLVHTHPGEPRVWTLPTAIWAQAALTYRRPERAFRWWRRMTAPLKRGLLGAWDELLPQGGEVVQLWSAATWLQLLVEGFWGVEPDALGGAVHLRPQLPSAWSSAHLAGVPVGDHRLDLVAERRGSGWRLGVRHARGPGPLRLVLGDQSSALAPGRERAFDWPGT